MISIFRRKNLSDKKERYTGLSCSTTGVFLHSFRKDDREVFSVSSTVVPNPDVMLAGYGKSLLCKKVDCQITLIPGVRRYITDKDDILYSFYEYAGINQFYAQIGEKRIPIIHDETGWSFSVNFNNDARIERLSEEKRIKGHENGFDTELRFIVEISEDIDPVWYPIIFAAPMLCF